MNVDKLKGKFKPESWHLLKQTLWLKKKCGSATQSATQSTPTELQTLYNTITSTYANIVKNMKITTKQNVQKTPKSTISDLVGKNPFIDPGQFDKWILNNNFSSAIFESTYSHYKISCQVFFTQKAHNIWNIVREIIAKYFTLAWMYRDRANIKFVILLSDQTKVLLCDKFDGTKGCVPGVKNVNTGSSTIFFNSNKPKIIQLWRNQELEKVAVHEIIHALELDFSNTRKFDRFLKDQLGLSANNVNSNEAYVEVWANILNCMFVSWKLSNNQKNWDLFCRLLNLEQTFSLGQISKICNYFQVVSIFDLSAIEQSSHVFSYYVLKGCYLANIQEFIQFCIHNQNANLIDVTQQNPPGLIGLFRSIYTPEFEQRIKMCDRQLCSDELCLKNLRMTVIELK